MEDKDDSVEADLRGNTLRVYWYMLQSGEPVGVREVQRDLGMSSPSVASHHLNKIIDMGLAQKNSESLYGLIEIVKVGILKDFIRFRGTLLPRYFFVAVFFTTIAGAYLLSWLFIPIGLFDRVIASIVLLAGIIFGWLETYRLWQLRYH
ncbi:hypothetical protein EU538_02600 [Candidatus Thorarchaeota archaeon]|jgi:hypothetical protein|nr:MAG: hypothetical protein EU538_02600 [Candidatus Thorarchaeota archaeon]